MGGTVVRQIGAFILAVIAIVATILAVALKWPWPWWAWVLLGTPCVIGGVLMIWRERKPSESHSARAKKNIARASGERSIAVNRNSGIIATGDNTTIER
jgi:membrane protein implicated in regulation of membrane protease activity